MKHFFSLLKLFFNITISIRDPLFNESSVNIKISLIEFK